MIGMSTIGSALPEKMTRMTTAKVSSSISAISRTSDSESNSLSLVELPESANDTAAERRHIDANAWKLST